MHMYVQRCISKLMNSLYSKRIFKEQKKMKILTLKNDNEFPNASLLIRLYFNDKTIKQHRQRCRCHLISQVNI